MKYAISIGISVLVVGMVLSGPVWGQPGAVPPGEVVEQEYHGTGRAAFTALKVGQSARAAGMGDAFTALSDDINAIFWNPAGLTNVERFEYAFGYTRWLVESRFLSGAVAWRYGQQTFGISLIQFDAGTSLETTPLDPSGKFGRTLHAGDIFVKASYARKMTDKLAVGISVKWIQETIDDLKMNSASFDFSTIFYTGFGSSRIAMTLNNYGGDLTLETPGMMAEGATVAQPLVYTIAGAMELIGRLGDPASLTVAGEMSYHIDDRERFHLGAELWFQNTLALRAGYRGRYDLGDWSLGAGLKKDMGGGRRIGVDFAYVDPGNLFRAPLRVSLAGAF